MKYVCEGVKIGKRIREEREKLSFSKEEREKYGLPMEQKRKIISQTDFAAIIDVESKDTVSQWERGRTPPMDKMLLMCDLFNCEIDYLLCAQDYKTKEATDIQEATGLHEYSITCLQRYRDYMNNSSCASINELNFDLLDFIDYLIQKYAMTIPMRINALLAIPVYPTDPKREDPIFAEIYYDIKNMINDIRKDRKEQTDRREEQAEARAKYKEWQEKQQKGVDQSGRNHKATE